MIVSDAQIEQGASITFDLHTAFIELERPLHITLFQFLGALL